MVLIAEFHAIRIAHISLQETDYKRHLNNQNLNLVTEQVHSVSQNRRVSTAPFSVIRLKLATSSMITMDNVLHGATSSPEFPRLVRKNTFSPETRIYVSKTGIDRFMQTAACFKQC